MRLWNIFQILLFLLSLTLYASDLHAQHEVGVPDFSYTIDSNGFVAATPGTETIVQEQGFLIERIELADGKPYFRMAIDESQDSFQDQNYTRAFDSGPDAGMEGMANHLAFFEDTSSSAGKKTFQEDDTILKGAFSTYHGYKCQQWPNGTDCSPGGGGGWGWGWGGGNSFTEAVIDGLEYNFQSDIVDRANTDGTGNGLTYSFRLNHVTNDDVPGTYNCGGGGCNPSGEWNWGQSWGNFVYDINQYIEDLDATGNGLVATAQYYAKGCSMAGFVDIYDQTNCPSLSEQVYQLKASQALTDSTGTTESFAATFDLTHDNNSYETSSPDHANKDNIYMTQDISVGNGTFRDDFYFHIKTTWDKVMGSQGANEILLEEEISDVMNINETGFDSAFEMEFINTVSGSGSWTSPWSQNVVTWNNGDSMFALGFTQKLTSSGFGDYLGFQEVDNKSNGSGVESKWWLSTDKPTYLLGLDLIAGQGSQ